MPITLVQIAKIAGVSRGTVDRALNDRGRVAPEVAKKIKQIAKEQGYQPNLAGKALALSKNPIRIGVVIQSVETPFMKMVLRDILIAQKNIEAQGARVYIKQTNAVDVDKQIRAIDELVSKGIDGLVITPADSNIICDKIDELSEELPVICFNTDMPESKRICFIGQDNYRSGCTCAGLMNMVLEGEGKVLIVEGDSSNRAHKIRCDGFMKEIHNQYGRIELLPIEKNYYNDEVAYHMVCDALRRYPDLKGLYISGNGQQGVCKALREMKLNKKIHLICHDLIPNNKKNLLEGTIDFLVGQNPYAQATRPLEILFDFLFTGKRPQSEFLYTDIIIKTKYNI